MHARALRWFLAGWSVVVIAAALAVAAMDRFDLHLAVNGHHAPLLDRVFSLGTHLADTPLPIMVSLLLLLHSWRAFLLAGLSTGLSAAVAQGIKHLLAADMDRPTMYLDLMPGLQLVPGVEQLSHHSFPSGHTTAAFSLGLALTVLVGRRAGAVGFVLYGAFIGLSRVYLSQHFTEDVLAGAIIGTLTGLLVYHFLYRTAIAERPWLSRSPFRA